MKLPAEVKALKTLPADARFEQIAAAVAAAAPIARKDPESRVTSKSYGCERSDWPKWYEELQRAVEMLFDVEFKRKVTRRIPAKAGRTTYYKRGYIEGTPLRVEAARLAFLYLAGFIESEATARLREGALRGFVEANFYRQANAIRVAREALACYYRSTEQRNANHESPTCV